MIKLNHSFLIVLYIKTIYFAECKWSNKKVGDDIYKELVRKSQLVLWHNETRKNKYILFRKSGFTERMTDLAKKENILLIHKDKVINNYVRS